MREYRLRTDIQRVVLDGFALPLGLAPAPGSLEPPTEGYTIAYAAGEDGEPDTYSFQVVVSHERLRPIIHKAFDLLPDEVTAIVEIGSRDAYRATDVYLSREPIDFEAFAAVWDQFQDFLLEDGTIAAGANNEESFVEVFVDQMKSLTIHVPLDMREDVEAMLQAFKLEEVPQTWPMHDPSDDSDVLDSSEVRGVLDLSDEFAPDVDELLLDLRHEWLLELDIDPQSNLDERGRSLGMTLWHAVAIVYSAATRDVQGAYASIWATAGSLQEMERLVEQAVAEKSDWEFGEIYTIDRVAFDERPDHLGDLPHQRRTSQVHAVHIEPWTGDVRADEARKNRARPEDAE